MKEERIMQEMKKDKLQSFIDEAKKNRDNSKGDFRFRLQRFSKDEQYWCVSACEYKENKVFYGGHFCCSPEANLHKILTILADSGWEIEFHKGFLIQVYCQSKKACL